MLNHISSSSVVNNSMIWEFIWHLAPLLQNAFYVYLFLTVFLRDFSAYSSNQALILDCFCYPAERLSNAFFSCFLFYVLKLSRLLITTYSLTEFFQMLFFIHYYLSSTKYSICFIEIGLPASFSPYFPLSNVALCSNTASLNTTIVASISFHVPDINCLLDIFP